MDLKDMTDEQLHQQIEAAQKELSERTRRRKEERVASILAIVETLEPNEAAEILNAAQAQLPDSDTQSSTELQEVNPPTSPSLGDLSSIAGSMALGAIQLPKQNKS